MGASGPDYGRFGFGGAQYPLASSTTNTLLKDADPSLYYAIDFFQSVLTTHLGPRVALEAAIAPALPFNVAVKTVVPYDPAPHMLETQFQFPLLAVYRVDEEINARTVNWEHRSCRWMFQYILPPLTAGQTEHAGPLLKAVGDVITNRIGNNGDPNYASGLNPWGPAAANLESIWMSGGKYGRLDAGGNLFFPTYSGTLLVRERVMPPSPDQFDKFAGVDATMDLSAPEQPAIDPFVQVSTQPAPTVTICTPNNGTNAGGTSVTLTGTGFVAGAAVTIGGVPCASVVVVSATSITCTTGAGLGPVGGYQVTVVVTNRDGQSGKLPLGFTFT